MEAIRVPAEIHSMGKAPTLRVRASSVILWIYLAMAALFFSILGDAMLNEETNIQFMADSVTYEHAARDLKDLTSLELIAFNPNYFGPVTILKLLGGSRWGVVCLNFVVFLLSLRLVGRAFPSNRKILVTLVCLNPMTFSSLLSINKEVFSLLTLSFLIYGLSRKSIFALVACIGCSFLVRWQLTFFILVYLGMISWINPLRRHRVITFLILAGSTSVLYAVLRPVAFSNVSEIASVGGETWEGTGLWGRLLGVQDVGGYFLIFPLKVLQAMFGILVYIYKIFNPPEFYNYVVVMLHSLVMLIALASVAYKRKFSFGSHVSYMALTYLLVFGLTPIYAPRYFYPVFFLLCILIAQKLPSVLKSRRADELVDSVTPAPA